MYEARGEEKNPSERTPLPWPSCGNSPSNPYTLQIPPGRTPHGESDPQVLHCHLATANMMILMLMFPLIHSRGTESGKKSWVHYPNDCIPLTAFSLQQTHTHTASSSRSFSFSQTCFKAQNSSLWSCKHTHTHRFPCLSPSPFRLQQFPSASVHSL